MTRTRRTFAFAVLTALVLLPAHFAPPLRAQGALSLSTGLAANNGTSGICFDVTALQSTKIYRLWCVGYGSGSETVEVYYNPSGLIVTPGSSTGYNASGWISLGQATFMGAGTGTSVEIPLNINLLMNPGDRFGFAIRHISGVGVGYRSGVAPWIFADSYLSINTQAWGGQVPLAGQFSFFPRQFCGKIAYDEGCYFKDNWFTYEVLDANLQPTGYAEIPGTINLRYSVSQPVDAASVQVTMNLRNAVTNAIVYTVSFNDAKPANTTLTATRQISFPGTFVGGYYKVEVIFNALNSCKKYADYTAPPSTLLMMPAGSTLCSVWPGDANNDGMVNYGDRAALNRYIHDANLRDTWLKGPNRYKLDAATNPLTYLKWEAQPGVPWATPDGCYMDTDGNGVVNNFDYLAMKLNWTKTHSGPSKGGTTPDGFRVSANYPNPFNPSTQLDYTLPERSVVRIAVVDMLGREVAVLADGTMDAGTHAARFDASGLSSGTYMARVMFTGMQTGETFAKTVTMTLGK